MSPRPGVRRAALLAALLGCIGLTAAPGARAESPSRAWGTLVSANPGLAMADGPVSAVVAPTPGYGTPDTVAHGAGDHGHEIILSTAPLKTRAADGTIKAVDDRLQADPDTPGAYSPINAPYALQVGQEVAQGFSIGPDARHTVHITPLDTDPAQSLLVGGGQAFATGTHTQTDTLQRPTPTGLESFEQLRDASAPEQFSYHLDLTGGQVAALQDQTLVVTQDGETVLTVPAPVSIDAAGRPIASTFALTGDVLTLTVQHREGPTQYPVLVDPEWDSSYDWSQRPGVGSEGWGTDSFNQPDFYDSFVLTEPPPGDTRDASGFNDHVGLIIRPKSRTGAFPEGARGELAFESPGASDAEATHITSVDFSDVTSVNYAPPDPRAPDGYGPSDRQVARLALYSSTGSTEGVYDYTKAGSGASDYAQTLTAPDGQGRFAVVALFTAPCRPDEAKAGCPRPLNPGNQSVQKVGSVDLHLTDDIAPTAKATGTLRDLADHWTNLTGPQDLTLNLQDGGSGVEHWNLLVTNPSGDHELDQSGPLCDADHNTPGQGSNICPFSQTVQEHEDITPFTEGENRFHLSTEDYATNSSDTAGQSDIWSVFLDRTKPTIQPSGPLYTSKDTWIDPAQLQGSLHLLDTDALSGIDHDHLTATDQTGATVLDRTSNGLCTSPDPVHQPCGSVGHDLSFDTSTFPEGKLILTATSTDQATNTSDPTSWRLLLDRTPPIARAHGDLVSLQDQWTNTTATKTVSIDGRDALSGVTSLDLVATNANGRKIVGTVPVCPDTAKDPDDGSCPHTTTGDVHVDVGDLPDGKTDYSVQAHDLAGHTSRIGDTWDTYIDHTPPPTPGGIAVSSDTPTTAEIHWNPVTDLPEGAQGVSYEYLVTRDGDPITQWTATPYPYAKAEGLPPGIDVGVLVKAIDQAGNGSEPGVGLGKLIDTTSVHPPVLYCRSLTRPSAASQQPTLTAPLPDLSSLRQAPSCPTKPNPGKGTDTAAFDQALSDIATEAMDTEKRCKAAGKCTAGWFKRSNYKNDREWHHIVAQTAKAAQPARDVFHEPAVHLSVQDHVNLVYLKSCFHRFLHSALYYEYVNDAIEAAYNLGANTSDLVPPRQRVIRALGFIREQLEAVDALIPPA